VHQEVAERVVELFDVGQHAHGRMVLTRARVVRAVPDVG
jgi:hypothetical protein